MPDVEVVTVSGVTGAAPEEPSLDLGYTVSVDAFSGPLDLLLFLVRKSELDIIDIPVATITDQFVALISMWQQQGELDLEVAGDFILMAATLLEIKARTIAPPPLDDGEKAAEDEEDALDPRADLIGKLLAYRRFKEAVGLLNQLEAERAQRVLRQTREEIPEDPEEAAGIDLGELDVTQLSKLWNTLLIRIGGGGPRTVMKDEMPIEGSIRKLTARAEDEKNLTLRQLFAGEATLQGRISMLMATLECTRQRIVYSQQHEQYADVELRFRDEAERVITPVVFPPDEPGKKRRRRPPLVTYQAAVPPTSEDLDEAVEQPEEKHETDEERFLRELNESCDLDGVLARVVDVEKGFQAYWDELHPPVVPTLPVVIDVVEAKAPAEAEPKTPELEKTEPEKVSLLAPVVEVPAAEVLVAEQPVAELPVAELPVALPTVEPPVVSEQVVEMVPLAVVEISAVLEPVAAEPILVEQAPVETPQVELPPVETPPAASLVAAQADVMIEPMSSASEPVAVPEALLTYSVVTPAPVPEALHADTSISEVATEPATAIEPPTADVVSHEPASDSVAFAVSHEPVIHVDDALETEIASAVEMPAIDTMPESIGEDAPISASLSQIEAITPAPEVVTEPHIEMPEPVAELEPDEVPEVVPEAQEALAQVVPDSLPPEAVAVEESRAVIPEVVAPEPLAIEEPVQEPVEEPIKEQAELSPAPVLVSVPETTSISIPASVPDPVPQPVDATPVMQAAPPVSVGSPRHFASRTLWLLLAGVAGGTLAGWWVSAHGEPSLPLLPPPVSAPLATLPAPLLAPVTPSTPILVIPSVPPSAELLRLAEGPIETWLLAYPEADSASPWPIVVPWMACLPHPTLPTSIEAFAESPSGFSGLPCAAWAQEQAWAWCAGGTWTAPVIPRFAAVVPELAFVLPLTLPATVDGWLIEPDLRQVPVATFAEPLGWTVLARPALPIPDSFILSVPSLLTADDDTLWQPSEEFLEFMFDEPVATPTESIP